jgi:hypothetical protein
MSGRAQDFCVTGSYANVSTAINGDINGKNAVPTRPIAATAMAPNSNNSNISFHLLYYLFGLYTKRFRSYL